MTILIGETILSIRNISKSYGQNHALSDVSLDVKKGEVHALVGENGSGKTTLMNILFGNPVISSTGGYTGEIIYCGEQLLLSDPEEALKIGIGMVHQELTLLPRMSVVENIKLNRETVKHIRLGRLGPLDWQSMRSDAQRAFSRLSVDIDDAAITGTLPIGHLQLVEIAREIDKTSLKILIFDEPTAVLTEDEAAQLTATIRWFAAQGTAVIYISHRLHEVIEVADTITVLRDGTMVASVPASEAHVDELARLMVGYDIDVACTQTAVRTATDKPIVSFRDFKVDMPGEQIHGVDLDIFEGEILGLAGLAGHGKLGLINGLMGFYPASGEVYLHGQRIPIGNARSTMLLGLSFVPENRREIGLILDESIAINICYPQIQVFRKHLRAKYLPGGGLIDYRALRAYSADVCDEYDIRCQSVMQPVKHLSGGNQQKVCVARAIEMKPEVLFIAEPTRGIDIGAKEIIFQILKQRAGQGMTVVIASSELRELRRVCDRIAVFHEGRIIAVLPHTASLEQLGLAISGELQPCAEGAHVHV